MGMFYDEEGALQGLGTGGRVVPIPADCRHPLGCVLPGC